MAASLPFAIAVFFITTFAIATPLTDEWSVVYNAMIMDAAPRNARDLLSAIGEMRWHIYTHLLVIPNLIYLALAPLVHFDARFFMFLTLASNALILVCAYSRGLRAAAFFAASVIVFSPARYMEMMWGFQFALGLSTSLGVVGLTLLDASAGHRHRDRFIAAGAIALLCGSLCSSVAPFALLATPIILLKPEYQAVLWKMLAIVLVALILTIVYTFGLAQALAGTFWFALLISTAVGSLLLSSPVGLTDFSFNARSAFGLAIFLLNVLFIFRAYRAGELARLAYGISLIAYGLFSLAAIGITRHYLGNWHLQCALPILVGTLWIADKSLDSRSNYSKYKTAGFIIVSVAAVTGYWNAFAYFGPAYRDYAISVRTHLLALADDPLQEKPYPATAGWDASPELVKFLRDSGNPDFRHSSR